MRKLISSTTIRIFLYSANLSLIWNSWSESTEGKLLPVEKRLCGNKRRGKKKKQHQEGHSSFLFSQKAVCKLVLLNSFTAWMWMHSLSRTSCGSAELETYQAWLMFWCYLLDAKRAIWRKSLSYLLAFCRAVGRNTPYETPDHRSHRTASHPTDNDRRAQTKTTGDLLI